MRRRQRAQDPASPPAELLRATLRTYLQIGHGGFRADRLWGLGLLLVELGDFGGCPGLQT